MVLHYRCLGRGQQSILILHGLFGSSDNWLSFARRLTEYYTVYLLDLRNHGSSPQSDLHNYELMAEDVFNFIQKQHLEKPHIIGHSMGGKVAMCLSQRAPHAFDKLIILDIAPKTYPIRHTEILKGLNDLDLNILKSRSRAFEALVELIPDSATRHFLLKNLKRHAKGHFYWAFNLPIITQTIEMIASYPSFTASFERPALFVRAAKSDYILAEDEDLIYQFYPQAKIETMLAGHWLHVEKPVELLEIILSQKGLNLKIKKP